MTTNPTVYLVDASPYIFRAFFSLPSSMVSPAGDRVGAVYGFAGFLIRLIAEEEPSHLALAFDRSLNTSFRNEIYPAYKAQRELPPPELVAHYLGLAGDSVDNIPGVRGVGAKTAVALLERFASIEELYANLEAVADLQIRGARSLASKLEAGRELAALSKQLTTLATDAPAKADLGGLKLAGADPEKVDPLFARLGFDKLRGRIPRWRDA